MGTQASSSARGGGDGPGVNVTINNTGDHSRIDDQIAYVHNYNYYKMDPAASSAERFATALKLLAGKMPRDAEKIIGEVVRDGYQSHKVAYYWALSLLSGRFFDDLGQEHFATLNRCTAMVDKNRRDGWMEALRVVTQFVSCLIYEVRYSRLDGAKLTQVFLAYDRLDGQRREEIRRHLDLVMTGALQDRMENRYVDEAKSLRMDGEREKRAWKFFEPDPCEPIRVQLPEPRMSATRRAAAWAGVIMAGGAQLAAFCFTIAAEPVLALLLAVGLGGGGWLIATRGRSWLVRKGQLAADASRHGEPVADSRYSLALPGPEDYTDPYKGGESDEADARHRREQGRLNTHRSFAALWVELRFMDHDPDGANKRGKWEAETRGLRAALASHVRRHYVRPDQGLGEVDWLIKWHASRAKKRWEDGTLRQHRDELRASGAMDGFLFASGTLAAAAGLICGAVGVFEGNPRIGGLLILLTAVGAAFIFGSRADVYQVHRHLHRAESALAEAEHAEEQRRFEEWEHELQGRPTDEEMARWLDYDKFYVKSMAMKDRNLVNRNLVTHAILTEDRWPCRSARVLYGPPRYSQYRVTVFLLTEGGVRQVRMDLDFRTGRVSNSHGTSFPYEKIAWAKVAEAGWRFDSGGRHVVVFDDEASARRRADDADAEDSWDRRLRPSEERPDPRGRLGEPVSRNGDIGDLKDVDSLIFAQALRLSLVNSEPIDIVVENFDRGFLDRFRENKAALLELALDNSGVAGAVRLLDTIAAEGPNWLRLQRERRNVQIDDFMEAQNWQAELPWVPGHTGLLEDPPATVIGQIIMGNPQPPTAVQDSAMAALGTLETQMRSYINTFPEGWGVTSASIAQWIDGFSQRLWQFQQYVPVGEWLKAQDLPQVTQWLDAAIRDLRQAQNVYIETYQNTVTEENKRLGIWQEAGRFAADQIQQATAYQNAVFNRSMQGLFDVNEENCFDCHRYIGIPGGGYCYDCARARGWVY
jgi:hypothetical protein